METPAQKKPWSKEAIVSAASLVFAGLLAVPSLLPWLWVALLALAGYTSIVGIRKTASGRYRGRALAIVSALLLGLVVTLFLVLGLIAFR